MMAPRLRLKKSTGWFAAGQEVATALEVLSDSAFKLYLYVCLNADRQTGRMDWEPVEVARLLHCGSPSLVASLDELCRRQVCVREEQGPDRRAVEICDRFWPYEKTLALERGMDLASYIQQVRQILLRPACVRATFTAADERLAGNFYRRGVTLIQWQRAIWLGCARKYITLLNRQSEMLVTSLYYFVGIVDEVTASATADDYWTHVHRKAEQLERRWLETRRNKASSSDGPHSSEDEMMETK